MSRVEDWFDRFRSQGDAEALGRIFDELGPRLQRIARHLAPDRAAAEDLIQATFLTAIEKRDTFDATRALEPWLTGILIQHASLARRARARVIDPARLDSRATDDPLDVAGARELSEVLAVALSKLKPADREVLLPLLLDGRRAIEIARELGRRPDTVNMCIHRGLARLRRLLPASFAIAVWTGSSHVRGLGAVKAEVMRQAHVQLGVAGGAGASIAVTTWGAAMTTKQIGLAAAALAVSLAVGGYLLVPSMREKSALSASVSSAALEPPAVEGGPRSLNLTTKNPPTEAPSRSEVPVMTPPDAKRLFELNVVRSDHRAAAGALVALMDSSHTLSSAKTDEKGWCRLEPKNGPADVYVRDDASLPYHTHIEIGGTPRRTIELPLGRDLSGRFTMSDGAKVPEFELRLSPNSATEGLAEADLTVFKALELTLYSGKDLSARLHVGPDGLFRFRDLPATSSGTLGLPSEFVFVVDGKSSGSSERVIASPTAGLQLEIAYRPRIIGRLIDAATRAPIVSSMFNCYVEFADGNTSMYGIEGSGDGRFTIPLAFRTDAVGLSLDRIRVFDDRIAYSTAKVKWNGPCTPFDAGDIECSFPPARSFEIRVVDLEGTPLPGAHAKSGDLDVVVADAHGIGVFHGLPYDAKSMRVVASGHALVDVALSKETISPLEVVLAPTNKLTIALPPEVVNRSGLSVSLVSTPLLFGGSSRMYDWLLRGEMVGTCHSASGDGGTKEGHVDFGFSADGRVEVEDIRTGIPFRIVLHGSDTGVMTSDGDALADVQVDSIGPREHRRIDLKLTPRNVQAMHVVHGRAVDEQGAPVSKALVSSHPDGGYWEASTDLDGKFDLEVANQRTVDVYVSKRGYVPFRVGALDVTSEQPLEARLKRGQDLRVELVDTHARPIEAEKVQAAIEGFGAPWRIDKGSAGLFTLCDLPDGLAQITVRVGGKEYVRTSDAHAGVARITLPDHGRLEASWAFTEPKDDSKTYQLALRPVGSDSIVQAEWLPWPENVTTHTFESVLPGEYTIGIESGAAETADGLDPVWSPLHPPAHITIVGGETRTVELHP